MATAPQVRWTCSRETWDRVVALSPTATVFHTPAWAELTADGAASDVLHAAWPDGREAVVPILLRPEGRGRAASLGGDGAYGGIIGTGHLGPDERWGLLKHLWRRFPDLCHYSNPLDGFLPLEIGLPWQPAPPTRWLELAALEAMRRRYRPDRRQAVRRYLARGVTTTLVAAPCGAPPGSITSGASSAPGCGWWWPASAARSPAWPSSPGRAPWPPPCRWSGTAVSPLTR